MITPAFPHSINPTEGKTVSVELIIVQVPANHPSKLPANYVPNIFLSI
jgi:hypothetical protein